MKIAIAGGHGTIAMHTTRLLSDAGHEVVSLIRSRDQTEDIEDAGGRAVIIDLESANPTELADAIGDVDVVMFAAGAGAGSGPERKETVDYQGAVTLVSAAETNSVGHYVMISSMGADADHSGADVFDVYLRAKGKADKAVRESGLGYTIVRPTSLTDGDPAGTVTLARSADGDNISRADVAAVLVEIIEHGPLNATLELTAGSTPIERALG